jgi:hypothetical protein
MKNLHRLDLSLGADADAESLQHLGDLADLQFLTVFLPKGTRLYGADFGFLRRLVNLRGWKFSTCAAGPAASATPRPALAAYEPPSVTYGLSDAMLRAMPHLPNLRSVNLMCNRIRGDGLKCLDVLPRLTYVNLDNNRISEEALKEYYLSHPAVELHAY